VLAGAGAVIVVLGLWGPPLTGGGRVRRSRPARVGPPSGWWWRGLAGLVVGGAVWAVTGWPAAGLWLGCGAAWLPSLALRNRQRAAEMGTAVAVARLAGMMRDQVVVGADVAQAVRGSVEMAPTAIAPAVRELADRLETEDPGEALGVFADQVGDPMAEMLAASLRFALTRRTGKLADLFDELTRRTEEQITMRRAIEKDRRRLRGMTWKVMLIVVVWVVGIYVWSGSYLAPYDGFTGQIVMACGGAVLAGGLVGLSRMDRIGMPARLHLREATS
jgi:hypothetical protein